MARRGRSTSAVSAASTPSRSASPVSTESEEDATTTNTTPVADINAKILDETYDIYVGDSPLAGPGLVQIAKEYGLEIDVPKRKIWVVLIGNHSAGKSSFINWYIEETIQACSVAIETTGFTIVTSGKKRETFSGPATLQLFQSLKSLTSMKGVLPALSTEIVPSRAKNFPLVTLLDTPGLVDGHMNYPFEPEESLVQLATQADLVFFFFDPIGQALCARTMNVVEKICETQGHKAHFFLSKADTVPDETDRQRVLVQIAQNLTYRLKDRQFSLNIPPIYIPRDEEVPVRNHINDVLKTIDSAVNMGVQKSLESLLNDSIRIQAVIEKKLKADDAARKYNSRDCGRGFFLLAVFLVPPLAILTAFVYRLGVIPENQLEVLRILDVYFSAMSMENISYMLLASFSSLGLWWLLIKKRKTLTAAERKLMNEHLSLVSEVIPEKHKALYGEYFAAHLNSPGRSG
ncbi:hypothetical protein HDV05_004114 [Chytridiales sp. JEL 0842]|nr:hypothetical protein HDV05_004114 [Chytridiales sp. JEL 0842]